MKKNTVVVLTKLLEKILKHHTEVVQNCFQNYYLLAKSFHLKQATSYNKF